MANNAVYRVEKTVVYENGKVLNECYSILFYQDQILNCMREELIELHQLISLALNDRKEVSDEQTRKLNLTKRYSSGTWSIICPVNPAMNG